jgi:hypothetical protein
VRLIANAWVRSTSRRSFVVREVRGGSASEAMRSTGSAMSGRRAVPWVSRRRRMPASIAIAITVTFSPMESRPSPCSQSERSGGMR